MGCQTDSIGRPGLLYELCLSGSPTDGTVLPFVFECLLLCPVWPLRGINKIARDAKLILTADLAYPVSCASLDHLLMAQHCHLSLNVYFNPPIAPYPLSPSTPHHPRPIDLICDIIAIEERTSKTRCI